MATISDVVRELESWAPAALQENYDNSGLLVGDVQTEVSGVLVSLDCTEAVIEEAVAQNCNVVLVHHPLIFSGLKKLTGATYVERTAILAIRKGVAIIAVHTNLDNVYTGVNARICDKLGIAKREILLPRSGDLMKLVTFVPHAHLEAVREALFHAGAGHIGNYDSCSFGTSGEGTFRSGVDSSPFVGEKGQLHSEGEVRLETVLPTYRKGAVLSALKQTHPYEEVAYDLYALQNSWEQRGAGMIGLLPEPLPWKDFLQEVKDTFACGTIRYTAPVSDHVQRVAVCGGSGSFLLPHAIAKRAHVFITGDFKYHQFFDADSKIQIADVGHFESEQFTKDLMAEFLREKFSTFAVRLSEVNTNPISYL